MNDLMACGLEQNRRCEMSLPGSSYQQCPNTARWELTFSLDGPRIACCAFHMDQSIEMHQQAMRAQQPTRALHTVQMDRITTRKKMVVSPETDKLDGTSSCIA